MMNSKMLLCFLLSIVASLAWANRESATIHGEIIVLEKANDQFFIAIDEHKSGLLPKEEGRIVYLTAPKTTLEELLCLGNRKIRAKGTLFRDKSGKWQMHLSSYRPMVAIIGQISEIDAGNKKQVRFFIDTRKSAMYKQGPTSLLIPQPEQINLSASEMQKEVLVLGFMAINNEGQRELDIVECYPYEEHVGEIVVASMQLQRGDTVFHILPSKKQRKLAYLNEKVVRVYGVKVKKGDKWLFHVMDYIALDPIEEE